MQHITLDTGDVRWSPRDKVDPALYRRLLDHVQAALHGRSDVPLCPGWSAHAVTDQGVLMLTLSHQMRDALAPIVTIGVAADRQQLAVLAKVLDKDRALARIAPEVLQRGPWCVVRLYQTIALVPPEDLAWLGDYERCIAWAWIDGLPTAPKVH